MRREPDLASSSPCLFPSMSKCPGHHVREICKFSWVSSKLRMLCQKVNEHSWAFPVLPWKIHCMAPVLSVEMTILEGAEGSPLPSSLTSMFDAHSRAFISAPYTSMNSPKAPFSEVI